MRTYEDFEVWIARDGDGYSVRASGAGESHRLVLDLDALERKTRELVEAFAGREAVDAPTQHAARELGRELFEIVFPRPIYGRWRELRAGYCRVRLHFDRAGALSALPWELLFDGHRFLAVSAETPIVRHPELHGPLESPLPPRPFRLLALLPQPLGQQDLDAEGELLAIREALGARISEKSVVVERIDRPTFGGLMERLEAAPPVHAIHFAGHGEAWPEFGDGALCLEREGRIRSSDSVPGFALAPVFRDARDLRFVFLNSCEGSRSGSTEDPGSLAQRLLEAGVPAVLALQTPIGDRAATTFCRAFYRQLASAGSLEAAVAAGRKALNSGAFGLAWASPTLYLRAATGRLLRPKLPWRKIVASAALLAIAALGFAAYQGKKIYEKSTRFVPAKPLIPVPSDPRCPSPAGLDLGFVYIKPGEITVGAPEGRGDADDRPMHKVSITRAFCVGAYEVTEDQWNAGLTNGRATIAPGVDLPRVSVTHDDVRSLLERLNRRDPEGKYRLLWEAEFEYVAKAGGSAAYAWGDREEDLIGRANCLDTQDRFEDLAPIGSFEPNA